MTISSETVDSGVSVVKQDDARSEKKLQTPIRYSLQRLRHAAEKLR
jgi:hypothetical protein